MKIIKKTIIQEKPVELLLMDDEKTVQVICEDEIISVSSGETWNNIKDEEWAQYGLMKIEVEKYLKKKMALERLMNIAQDAF